MGSSTVITAGSRRVELFLVIGIAAVTFVARLVPVLRGGGLLGLGNYDDGVYYGAATGLVHGRMPYRDFLLLHPPGILLVLAPWAAVGRLFGDPVGFAAARLAWMLMGVLSGLLIFRILRPVGVVAALTGSVFYAVFYPAIYGDHSTLLEGLATLCTMVALWLIIKARHGRPGHLELLAGVALGFSASTKIWGVVAALVVVVWMVVTVGPRRASKVAWGTLLGAVAVCLPFFVAAPTQMWRMVVTDQLARPLVSTGTVLRVMQIIGQSRSPTLTPAAVGIAVVMAALALCACRSWIGRLAVALLASGGLLLLVAPSWFFHYTAMTAGYLALTVGIGVNEVVAWSTRRSRGLGRLVIAAAIAGIVFCALPLHVAPGHRFPSHQLDAAMSRLPGCVTADDPATLIELNVMGRNLDRGCRLVVDLGGQSYDNPPPAGTSRARDAAWQSYVLAYLRSGSAALLTRFSAHHGLSVATSTAIRGWTRIDRSGRYVLLGPAAAH